MKQMFVHYNGTVAAFKAAGLESQYSNHIVFIKGGEDGTGAAVYTHGEYYGNYNDAIAALNAKVNGIYSFNKIAAGDKVAEITSANGTINFSAADPAQVSVNVDTDGVSFGLSTDFVNKVNTTASGLSEEISRATGVEAKLRQDLGQSTDEASAEGSVFARIAAINDELDSLSGGAGSIQSQITKAIEALDVNEVSGDYIKSVKQVDGKIEATVGTFNFDEKGAAAEALDSAKSYVDGKVVEVKAYADQAETDAVSAANLYTDGKITEINGTINTKVGEINGEIAGVKESVQGHEGRIVAVEEDLAYFFGDALNKENVEAVKDTLKEIQDYINSDVQGAAGMTASIKEAKDAANAAQGEVDALEVVVAGVKSTADQAAADVAAEVSRATGEEGRLAGLISGVDGRVATIEGDYLKASDKNELAELINGKVSQSDYNTKVQELTELINGKSNADQKYVDDKIAALDAEFAVDGNKFVTGLTQVDGVIMNVTRSEIQASQVKITNADDDAFDAATVTVQDALVELANAWTWIEL